ncbi:MAG: Lrp/AsnC ligand binding domain-containing protein [Theionarchaea archaeon]|nr:Lrp/AsnC ligand binding domain-containing protein [Theionarchaea archaeon]
MTANFVIPQDVQRFFVLVDVEPGEEDAVMEELTRFPETKEIHLIAGKHDILLCIDIERKILEESLEKGLKFIKGKIRPLPGVRDTDTLMVGKSFIRKAP